jgi:hypothetical protein
LILSGFHLLLVLVLIGADIYRSYASTTSELNFAIDAPSRFTGGYNLMAIFLMASYAFGRRFRISALILVIYSFLHIYSIYVRLQGCFLGEDVCPPVDVWTKALSRLDWFDAYLFVILLTLIMWQVIYLFKPAKEQLQ